MSTATDLTSDTILDRLRPLGSAIRAEGVTRLWLVGSRIRGDARPDAISTF